MVLAECTLLSSIGVLVMIGIGNRQVLNVNRGTIDNTIVHATISRCRSCGCPIFMYLDTKQCKRQFTLGRPLYLRQYQVDLLFQINKMSAIVLRLGM